MRALFPLLLVLLVPASASAGSLGEVSPLDLRGDEYCARATGVPGELAVVTANGMRLVRATRDALTPGRELRLGTSFRCGAVSGHPSGAAVIAGESGTGDVVAIVREPGGDWGAPQTVVADDAQADVLQVVANVSERGDVIVGVKEELGKAGYRFRVARRAPGGAFSTPEQVGRSVSNAGQLTVDIAATGEAFALLTTIEGKRAPFSEPVSVAIAAPGQAFGAPAHIADSRWLSYPALAVAADGRALVTVPDGTSVLLAERVPGAPGFGPAAAVASAPADLSIVTSVRVGASGAAAIGWVQSTEDAVVLLQRSAPGPFTGAPRVVLDIPSLPKGFDPFYASQTFISQLFSDGGDLGGGFTRGEPASFLALSPFDGRALLAVASGPLGSSNQGVGLASASVDTVLADLAVTRLPRATRALPLTLADGVRAVAWTTALPTSERYRLHVASPETVERADPAVPRITVGRQDRRLVSDTRAVRLPITCNGPCEVNAFVDLGGLTVPYGLRMSKAGTRSLKLDGLEVLAGRKLTRVPIELTYGAPGALHPRSRTIRVSVRSSAPPEPRAVRLKAVRRADEVVVTFQLLGNPREWGAFLTGDDTRGWSGEPAVSRIVRGRAKQRTYRATLPAAGVNYVTLRTPRVLTLPGPKLVAKVR